MGDDTLKNKAEQKNKKAIEKYALAIIEQTPNGVLVVDKETRILFVNNSFCSMFQCSAEEAMGQKAFEWVHSDCFDRAIKAGGRLIIKESASKHNVSYRAEIFPIKGGDLYSGIFVDISEEEKTKKHYHELRAQTLDRAQEVISSQMKTAQEIARLLGETTAETKVLLVKLMSLFKEAK